MSISVRSQPQQMMVAGRMADQVKRSRRGDLVEATFENVAELGEADSRGASARTARPPGEERLGLVW
jgi:hypothetical protein